jgi:hypothetical protein
MVAASAAWYSLKYFWALALAEALAAALAFLAASLLSLSALRSLASLACFLRMFSGTTLALNLRKIKLRMVKRLTLLPYMLNINK